MNKTFHLGTSPTIGTLILPGDPLINLSEYLESKIKLTIEPCDKIVAGVKDKTFDLGLIESPVFDVTLDCREWMEDELVLCSNIPLADSLEKEDLEEYHLLCRHSNSPTRIFIDDVFTKLNLSYQTFYSLREVDNASAAIQSIKWSKLNTKHPTVAIVSQLAIEEELDKKSLYQSRIKSYPMIRKFYLVHNQETLDNKSLNTIISILQNWQET